MKTETKLSNKVKLILETSNLRVVEVVKGWDKGSILIQNQNDLLSGWGKIVRVSEKDAEILINNLTK
tara:strand:- start:224 stop:424 length:201 start_codon:yes stop_codon:yes gene_type:complete